MMMLMLMPMMMDMAEEEFINVKPFSGKGKL